MQTRRAGAGVVAVVGIGLWTVAAAPAAHAQVKLEYKYPEGETITYKTTTKMKQVITIMGMEIPTEVDQTLVSSQVNGKRAADASLPVREKVDSIRTEISLPGGAEVTYDSKEGEPKVSDDMYAFLGDVLKMAAESSYTIVLDGKNKVKAIEGTEKLQEKAEQLDPKVRDALRSHLSADKLKAEFEESHNNLPDVLARPGEPWERTHTMEGGTGQAMAFRKKYEYAGTEKKGDKTLDKITVKTIDVKLKEDPDSKAPAKITKSDLKVESSDETILFDREAGRVVESRQKIHIKGTMTLSVAGQELSGEIEIDMDNNRELQPGAK